MIMKGQKINDRYQIIKSIGEGGMANVYLAYDTILDRNVAVKVLRGDLATDEKFVRRFQREALAASSLSHPNIVEVYDVGEDNGQYFIVMEYIEGQNLKTLLKKRGNLTIPEVIDIMLQITAGMTVAHDSYIIHRDIKPQNIMILENGLIKITDFGIAMAMNATQLTQTNSVMGSVHYLPPEQANGKGSTLKSDIYSMGILMYELLTGKLPYKGDNAVEIALKHLKEPLPSIKDELPNIPQSVENVILKAAAKNPKNRYNDAKEMHDDLKTCLDEARINEPKYEYPYPEFDDDGKNGLLRNKKVEENAKFTDLEASEVVAKQVSENEYKKQNKLLLILGILFTSLIVIITAIVVLLPIITGQKEIKVPDVTDKSVTEAIELLQNAGFSVSDDQKEEASDTIKEGNVIKTSPEVGTKRTKGTSIVLTVSIGENAYTVEDLTGQNYLEVKGKLEAYGIKVYVEKKDTTEKVDDNAIIGISAKNGDKLKSGDSITLYIPNVQTKFPDFTDGSYNITDVVAFCEQYNVKLTVQDSGGNSIDPSTATGSITYQSRPVGYTVVSGGTLLIKTSTQAVTEEEDTCGLRDEEGNCIDN